jgi:ceramide glucosyltransferase
VETLFYFLAILQIATGVYLVRQGLQWLAFVRKRVSTDPGFYAPRTAVLCPCKGMEPGLEHNLVALTEFDHRNYELFFVLASAQDPAYSTVKRIAGSSRVKAHVVIAEKPDGCGEKVNNLRTAVAQVPPEFEVLVFVDSDGRPSRSWLHHLTAPLKDPRVGATTTMRWLIPNDSGFSTALLAAWNAPLVTMLTEDGPNFCWGGGTAIRRTTFEQANVLEEWSHSVSDDLSMTNVLQHAGQPIVFLPECIVPSYVRADFDALLEFTNRQVMITRVYAQKMWATAAATHFLYCLTVVLGLFSIFGELLAGRPTLHLVALVFFPLLLSAIRGAIRVAGVTEALPALRSQIMGQAWIYIVLNVAVPFLYVANFIHSLLSRKIRWRGVQYELISAQQTRILVY